MPGDELSFPANLENHRRSISNRLVGQRSPEFFARRLVEADDECPVRSSDQSDELLTIDQRRGDHPPDRQVRAKLLDKVFLPEDLAGFLFEGEHVTLRTHRKHSAIVDDRRGSRPGRVAHRVQRVVLVTPDGIAGFRIEAQNPLGLLASVPCGQPVGHEDSPVRDSGSGVTITDLRCPHSRDGSLFVLWQFLDNTRLTPDEVALRPAPLSPVVGGCGKCQQSKSTTESEPQHR